MNNNNNNISGATQLTPYQGSKRVYGSFKCTNCHRTWESGNSWANSGQMCSRCKIMIYPYNQTELLKPGDNKVDLNKPHPAEYCEKCQKLGRSCRGF